jgi:hypothetical protein
LTGCVAFVSSSFHSVLFSLRCFQKYPENPATTQKGKHTGHAAGA